jgi:hypothetical protein
MKPFIILSLIAISITLSIPFPNTIFRPNFLLDPTCDRVKIRAGTINREGAPY